MGFLLRFVLTYSSIHSIIILVHCYFLWIVRTPHLGGLFDTAANYLKERSGYDFLITLKDEQRVLTGGLCYFHWKPSVCSVECKYIPCQGG